ncbi:chymotrypsin BII-like [Eriocheir sinensis]|uniref:chymotrypsin BII-like n=1 Tax=Eriocheir sinensis TaxID=95602 RepID=UPI0021C7080F|nr:chymotrypsin BII-like [Eriocheir sinensis]
MAGELTLLLLLCFSASSGNPAAEKQWRWKFPRPQVTPLKPAKASRIVGGFEAAPHSWPHQVALFIDDTFFCGGSLISNEWVLTAAHCMDGAGFVEVVMGAHNISKAEPSQITQHSVDFFTHENWNDRKLINDIALIRLPSAVTFNSHISAVSLPSYDIGANEMVVATGWGQPSNDAGSISSVIRQVQLFTISNHDCGAAYFSFIGPNIVCIDGSNNKGTCNGDSGGPLGKDGEIHGITSFGSSLGCTGGYPDAFTRVYHYMDWITNKTSHTTE